MPQDANKGLHKLYWTIVVTVVFILVLGAVLWWADDYVLKLR